MKSFAKSTAFLLICACLVGADAPEPPTFKSPKARDGRTLFDAEMKSADEEYAAKALKSMKTYKDTLLQAKGIATRSGDLDDANAIQATIKHLDEDMADVTAQGKAKGVLTITKVQWGSETKWVDVTKLAQANVQNGALRPMGPLPDPASGKDKTLVMEGIYGGRPFMIVYNTADSQGDFYFGKPMDRHKSGNGPKSN
jgi:hypothetical protein